MSQYQDYFFSDHQDSNHQFLLNSPVFQNERFGVQLWGELNQPEKKIAETTQTYCYTELRQNLDQKQSFQAQIQSKFKERSRHVIICQEEVAQRHHYNFRGFKNDTVLLNTNFKTIILSYLKELLQAKQLQKQERIAILEFKKDVASFFSVNKLMKNSKIKNKCKNLIQSSQIIKMIMVSKIQLQTKLRMVKHIQALRNTIQTDNIIKWKQNTL